ncbi:40-residue YVTN family beta-propeller repeat [Mycobacterium tuberculosis]|nr:40-residue YVTN family beta-propeller repeat [Mycobacterium tuberculosis]
MIVINPANDIVATVTLSPGPISGSALHSLPGAVAVSPTGPHSGDIYVTDFSGTGTNQVQVINPATNQGTAMIPLATQMGNPLPSTSVVIPTTGPFAGDILVGSQSNGPVTVIDPVTNLVIDTINIDSPIGPFAPALAASPTGPAAGDIYVSNGQLWVIS